MTNFVTSLSYFTAEYWLDGHEKSGPLALVPISAWEDLYSVLVRQRNSLH